MANARVGDVFGNLTWNGNSWVPTASAGAFDAAFGAPTSSVNTAQLNAQIAAAQRSAQAASQPQPQAQPQQVQAPAAAPTPQFSLPAATPTPAPTPATDYVGAYNSALQATQAQYANIVAQMNANNSTIQSQQQASQQAVIDAYNQRYSDLVGKLGGLGDSQRQQLGQNFAMQQSQAEQALARRGLTSSSALDAAQRGVNLDYNKSRSVLEDALTRESTGFAQQLSGDTTNYLAQSEKDKVALSSMLSGQQLAFLQSVQQAYPNMGLYAQLAQMAANANRGAGAGMATQTAGFNSGNPYAGAGTGGAPRGASPQQASPSSSGSMGASIGYNPNSNPNYWNPASQNYGVGTPDYYAITPTPESLGLGSYGAGVLGGIDSLGAGALLSGLGGFSALGALGGMYGNSTTNPSSYGGPYANDTSGNQSLYSLDFGGGYDSGSDFGIWGGFGGGE